MVYIFLIQKYLDKNDMILVVTNNIDSPILIFLKINDYKLFNLNKNIDFTYSSLNKIQTHIIWFYYRFSHQWMCK